jgi:hypothetical protein
MAILIKVLTDIRAKELLPTLLKLPKLNVVKEIDSLNYGEGFDITYEGLEIRLYDDYRSDEVMSDAEFLNGKISWDQAFDKAIIKFRGKVSLNIEIDRHHNQTKELRMEAATALSNLLKTSNFELTVETFGAD